jgi:hypothetical protein
MGEGKALPQGPECIFNEIFLPCYCCCSEIRSITGNLLRSMLEAIDGLQEFDWTTGLNPFLLLDGHGRDGNVASDCHMVLHIGRLEIVVSRMGLV